MNSIRSRFLHLFLIFGCAMSLTVIVAKGTLPVDAEGLPKPIFDSPGGGGGGSGGGGAPPPSNLANPAGATMVTTDPTNSQGVAVLVPAGAVNVPAQLEVFRNVPPNTLPGVPTGPAPLNAPPVSAPAGESSSDDSSSTDQSDTAPPPQPIPLNVIEAFFTGFWNVGSIPGAVAEFNKSVGFTVKYQYDGPLPQDKIRLYMYNPAAQDWTKLCSVADPELKEVWAAVHKMIPFDSGTDDNSLLAVGIDLTSALSQTVNFETGVTTLVLPELPAVTLEVAPGTINPGDNFEISPITYTTTSAIIDYKVCHIAHTPDGQDKQNSYQVLEFPKPITTTFRYNADELAYDLQTLANSGVTPGEDTLWVIYENAWLTYQEALSMATSSSVPLPYQVTQNSVIATRNSPGTVGFKIAPALSATISPTSPISP